MIVADAENPVVALGALILGGVALYRTTKVFGSTLKKPRIPSISLPSVAATSQTWCGMYIGDTEVDANLIGRPVFLFKDGAVLTMDKKYVPIVTPDGGVSPASTIDINLKRDQVLLGSAPGLVDSSG